MNATNHALSARGDVLEDHRLASVTLAIKWSDGIAEHENEMHLEKFSVFREIDSLPPEISSRLIGMHPGDQLEAKFSPASLVSAWDSKNLITARPSGFDTHFRKGLVVQPKKGRFYPQGFFHKTHHVFRDAVEPARILDLTADKMVVDFNHPLARYAIDLRLRLDHILPGFDRRGGRCATPVDDLMHYPGLSAALADGSETDFGDRDTGMARMDEQDDSLFYQQTRMVQHLDSRALRIINALYRRLIPQQAAVLDLMASHDSHLDGITTTRLSALGMNAEELAKNRKASDWRVEDLNKTDRLPYEENSFDAIVCTASVEYLVNPLGILAEALRTLKPGGVLAITFSNRWFPQKAIRLWSELHEFERLGLVKQWLKRAGFERLHTHCSSGWPRPENDPHVQRTPFADPVYAVWGYKSGV